MKTLKESNGDLVMPLRFIEGDEFNEQTINNALATYKASWYKDRSKGIDYQGIITKRYSKDEVIADMQREINNTGRVVSIPYIGLGIADGVMQVNYTVETKDDDGNN